MKYIKSVKIAIAINSYKLMGSTEIIINSPVDEQAISEIITSYLRKFNIDVDLAVETANKAAEYIIELTQEFNANNNNKSFTVPLKNGNEYTENIRVEIQTLDTITII